MAALPILLISVCCLVAGAAGVTAVLSGPGSIPLAPLFAVFGWFYLFPIYLLVALMWVLYVQRMARMAWPLLFVLSGAALGGGLMALVGSGVRDLQMHDGMLLGGLLAGCVSNLMIVFLKWHRAETGATPDGGPAESLGNLGVSGGPPSVSSLST